MRLPLTKVHRAFAELDGFSDAQCAAWVKQAWRSHRGRFWAYWLVVVPLSILAPFGIFVGGMLVLVWAIPPRQAAQTEWFFLLPVFLVAPSVLGPALLNLLIRDTLLRRMIRARLGVLRCAPCGYPLLGLTARENTVQCPECGAATDLAALGLSAADLIPPPSPVPAGPAAEPRP